MFNNRLNMNHYNLEYILIKYINPGKVKFLSCIILMVVVLDMTQPLL